MAKNRTTNAVVHDRRKNLESVHAKYQAVDFDRVQLEQAGIKPRTYLNTMRCFREAGLPVPITPKSVPTSSLIVRVNGNGPAVKRFAALSTLERGAIIDAWFANLPTL